MRLKVGWQTVVTLAPLVFFLFIGHAMQESRGHYSVSLILIFTVLFFGYFATNLVKQKRSAVRNPLRVCSGFFVLSVLMVYLKPRLLNATSPVIVEVLKTDLLVALLLSGLISVFLWLNDRRIQAFIPSLIGAALFTLFFARVLTLFASPHPFIDVFTSTTAATEFFLKGLNPYAQSYQDIYGGYFDYAPGMVYWPGVLYWLTPFRAIFGDIRWGFVFADVITTITIFRIGKKFGFLSTTSGLFALIWLAFPASLFILEQSWVDGLGVMSFLVFLWLVLEERWELAGVALGYLVTVKQYACIAGVVSVLWLTARQQWKPASKVCLSGVVTMGAIFAPFLIFHPHEFIWMTITVPLHQMARTDSFSLFALVENGLQRHWPNLLSVGLSLGSLLFCISSFWWRKSRSYFDLTSTLAIVFGVVFLTGKQAFCNYYYFMAVFVFASALCRLAGEEAVDEMANDC